MRKLIAIILVLIGFVSQAQTYLVQPAKWRFTNSQRFDSTVRFYNLPLFTGDTIIGFNPLTGKLGRKILTSSIPVWGTITGTLSNQTDLQNALNAKQATLTLTTTGTSGAATLTGATLNIPQYSGTTYTGGNGIIVSGSTIYRDSLKTTGQYGNTWGNGMYLGSSNNRSILWRTNGLQRMRLDSNGRFLLGTTPSIYKLRVQATDELGVHISTVGGNAANPPFYFTSTTQSTDLEFYLDNNYAYIGPYGNKGIQFVKNAGGDKTVLINNSGNLLVGTQTDIPSAKVVINSTTQGFLPPLMTTTQRTSISSPAEGLTVYDLTLHKLYVYDGTTWQAVW